MEGMWVIIIFTLGLWKKSKCCKYILLEQNLVGTKLWGVFTLEPNNHWHNCPLDTNIPIQIKNNNIDWHMLILLSKNKLPTIIPPVTFVLTFTSFMCFAQLVATFLSNFTYSNVLMLSSYSCICHPLVQELYASTRNMCHSFWVLESLFT